MRTALLFLLLLLLPTLHGFSAFLKTAPYVSHHGLVQRREYSTTMYSAMSAVKTGKDGKPATSADQDLELTRSIIMAHQDKYSNTNAPITTESITHVSPLIDTSSPTILHQASATPRTTGISTKKSLWFVFGLAAVAIATTSNPQLLSVAFKNGSLKTLFK